MSPLARLIRRLLSPPRTRGLPLCLASEEERNQARVDAYQARLAASREVDAKPLSLAQRGERGRQVLFGLQRLWKRRAKIARRRRDVRDQARSADERNATVRPIQSARLAARRGG